ncbi:hypothetical protein TNCV_2566981 [Trichonephila clavipes]|uniref:Uncharacterized protein n=1 Tax=Trichonephila clavipes TaxID=2585209 RepID=A0A8X7BLS8_TRICX|nr:hypothetical protein TNCV_2566981 [Trichonephila clavipes]
MTHRSYNEMNDKNTGGHFRRNSLSRDGMLRTGKYTKVGQTGHRNHTRTHNRTDDEIVLGIIYKLTQLAYDLVLSRDEFRGPRSDFIRQVALVTTTTAYD